MGNWPCHILVPSTWGLAGRKETLCFIFYLPFISMSGTPAENLEYILHSGETKICLKDNHFVHSV